MNKTEKELIAELLRDKSFKSDRARARALAEKTGINPVTAQTKMSRARRFGMLSTNRHKGDSLKHPSAPERDV